MATLRRARTRKARLPMPDGRGLRTVRTRVGVVDAMLDLITEGDLRPTSKRIAERAGVSERTVFQHFADLETLFAVAAERQISRLGELALPHPATGPLGKRLDEFVERRAIQLETITPVRRAALLNEPFSPALAERLAWAREVARNEVARTFAPELDKRAAADRTELLAALDSASTWTAWNALRQDNGLSKPAAGRTMRRTLAALLTHDPAKKEGASWNI